MEEVSNVNVILLSHGNYGKGILDSHNMIVGENKKIHSLSLMDSVVQFKKDLNKLVTRLLEEGDVLALCDLRGGTPFNQILEKKFQTPESIHIISGMNLPMLIEISLHLEQRTELKSLIKLAIEAGEDGIVLEEDNQNDLDF